MTRWCSACPGRRCAGRTAPGSAPTAGSGWTTCRPGTRTSSSTRAGRPWRRSPTAAAQQDRRTETEFDQAPSAAPDIQESSWPSRSGRCRAATPAPAVAVEDHGADAGPLPEPRVRRDEAAAHRLRQLRAVRRQAGPLGLTGRAPVAGQQYPADPRGLQDALGVVLDDAELLRRALTHRSYAYENGGAAAQRAAGVPRRLRARHRRHRHPLPRPPRPPRGQAGQAARLGGQHAGAGRRSPAASARTGSAPTCCSAAARRAPAGATSVASWPTPSRPCSARSTSTAASTRPTRVIHLLFDDLLEDVASAGAGLDWKTSLQELTAEHGLGVPEYVMTSTGPDHEKTFTAQAHVAGELFAASHRAQQEGGRAAGRRDRLAGDLRAGLADPRAESDRLTLSRCPNCPRSRPSATACDRWVRGRTVASVEVRHPRAVRRHLAGGADFAARLTGAAHRGGVAGAASTSGCRWAAPTAPAASASSATSA